MKLPSLRRYKLTTEDTTALFNERTFYKAFSNDFKTAQHEVIIESPYVTIRRASELAIISKGVISRGVVIVLYTRNPEHHDGMLRQQAYSGLEVLRTAGFKIKLCDDMRHRKIASIDRHILWEGSLNMLSQSSSKEIMRRTNSAELCIQMLKFTGLVGFNDARVGI
jgi:phosphatidylserine/phosphatidylglycerophosphate/cardiolipin synthase-like enzyme